MFLSIDGDRIGKILEQYILDENLEKLSEFSKSIKNDVNNFVDIIKKNNGYVYMDGGDNLFASIEDTYVEIITTYVKEKNKTNQYTFSIGFGKNVSDTYLALKYAKSNVFNEKCILLIRNNKDLEFKVL